MNAADDIDTVDAAGPWWRRLNPWYAGLAVFATALFVLLCVRASDPDRWSDWPVGDAQTLLSVRQWGEGGWLPNFLLFVPQGYAKGIETLDDPAVRHHAHGTCPGVSPRVGPRLRYTHYPSGYLVPYAALYRLGLTGMFPARVLSLVLSFAGLALLMAVFSRLTSPPVAFLSTLFYALSPSFLGYADTLANQPIDDMLRFGFMLAVVLSTRAKEGARRRWVAVAWLAEFLISLSSFDSVFFAYGWLIAWDLLEGLGFRWKRYLAFATAPVLAHGLQFAQNVWYLGKADAVTDILDTFLQKSTGGQQQGRDLTRAQVVLRALWNVFGERSPVSPAARTALLVLPAAAYAGHTIVSGEGERRGLPSWPLLLALFVCGLLFTLVFPIAGLMSYQSRQLIPFLSLLAAAATWSVFTGARLALRPEADAVRTLGTGVRRVLSTVHLFASAGALFVFWTFFAFADRSAAFAVEPNDPNVVFAKILKTIPTRYDPVFFDLAGFRAFIEPAYVPGYPQIWPTLEYYAGRRPILCFDAPALVTADLEYLLRKSPARFSPVLISPDKRVLGTLVTSLQRESILVGVPLGVYSVAGRFVLDLTDFVRWDISEHPALRRSPTLRPRT